MHTPEDPMNAGSPQAETHRRKRLLSASRTAITVALLAGVTYVAVASRRPALNVADVTRGSAPSPDPRVLVQAHTKMQAYGPMWSLHRPRDIPSYYRTAAAAA